MWYFLFSFKPVNNEKETPLMNDKLSTSGTETNSAVEMLLRQNPDINFEEDVFIFTARTLGYENDAREWAQGLDYASTGREMLDRVIPELQERFFTLYIRHFKRRLVV
jgi:hypothetical protein